MLAVSECRFQNDIPTVLHESNAVPGVAVKLSSKQG